MTKTNKYTKIRDCDYISKTIITPSLTIKNNKNNNEYNTHIQNKNLVTSQLFEFLSEPKSKPKNKENSTDINTIYSKAIQLGINVLDQKTKKLKNMTSLKSDFKQALIYVNNLDELYDISGKISKKDCIFKVKNLREFATILGIEINEKQTREKIYLEINKKIIKIFSKE